MSSANASDSDLTKNLPFGKELTFSQKANVRFFQTQRLCRQQFQIDENGRKLGSLLQNGFVTVYRNRNKVSLTRFVSITTKQVSITKRVVTKLSWQVENAAGTGEIACYEQFLLFTLCFLKSCIADT